MPKGQAEPTEVGEVARGLSLFGGASSEARRCNCSVVDESRSSLAGLAARCVSFYLKSIYLYLSRCSLKHHLLWHGLVS